MVSPETIEIIWIPALLGLIRLLVVAKQLLESLYDLKRELYKNKILEDRGEKGKRY